jgi:hypothetical protein
MISRKQCINIPTATYSGKEMSPLRFGISAEEFDVGTVQEGHDGLNWIVKIKNNRKVWVRICVPCDKMVHEIHKIEKNEEEIAQDKANTTDTADIEVIDEEQPIIKTQEKPKIVEKKLTNYNIFLAYRLDKLKKTYSVSGDKKTNKEIFTEVLSEWKNIDKTSSEFDDIMNEAKTFQKSK